MFSRIKKAAAGDLQAASSLMLSKVLSESIFADLWSSVVTRQGC